MTHLTIVALVTASYYGGLGWLLAGDVGLGLGCVLAATAFRIVAPSLSIPVRGSDRPRGFPVDGLAARPAPVRLYGAQAARVHNGPQRGRAG